MTAKEAADLLGINEAQVRIVEPDRFYKGMVEATIDGRTYAACVVTEGGFREAVDAIAERIAQ